MKKAAVFGIGDNFVRNYDHLKVKYEITALIDNSSQKKGVVIDGLPVVPLNALTDVPYDLVIITPNNYREIMKQLLENGIEAERIALLGDILDVDHWDGVLHIAFCIYGGLGDYLVAANYLYLFRQRFKNPRITIDLFCGTGSQMASAVFGEKDLAENIFPNPSEPSLDPKYGLVIQLTRYPEIVRSEMDKVYRVDPDLLDYIFVCEKFKIINKRYFVPGLINDGQSAALAEYEGIKRIQQPDVYQILGIKEEFQYPLFIAEDETRYLTGLGLKPNEYLTVHRGCDLRYCQHSTKLWPIDYYDVLIHKIKENYPSLPVLQIGASHTMCLDMDGTDYNLVEKTTLEQVKVLLKNSLIHIDNEGGMVHLRHALHGGNSIVIFGPTSEKFFGYSENRNIRGKGCAHWCEWVTDTWQVKCARGFEEAPCMRSITPERIFREVSKQLEELGWTKK